jgi:hypothetical protein
MASEYKRKMGTDTWHFCVNCSLWPTDDFVSSDVLPRSYQICNECMYKNQHGCDCMNDIEHHPQTPVQRS